MSSNPSVRVAAGTVFYQTEQILVLAMWNLVSQGVTDFYLLCHDSEPTQGAFEQFDGVATIHLAYKRTPPFFQGRMMTLLAEAAKRDGFDVFIPFDSDEFAESIDENKGLLQQVSEWAESKASVALAVDYQNYLLPNSVQDFTGSDLARAVYAIKPEGSESSSNPSAEASGIRRGSDTKVWLNLSLIEGSNSFSITEGFHSVYVNGALQKPILATGLKMAHLPYQGYSQMVKNRAHSKRRLAAGFSTNMSKHKHAFSDNDETEMIRTWGERSWVEESGKVVFAVPRQGTVLSYDNAFERIAARLFAAQAMQAASSGTKITVSLGLTQHLVDIAVDSDTGFPARNSMVWQLRAAVAQREELEKLLQQHAPQLGVKYESRSKGRLAILKLARKVLKNK